MGLNPDGTPAPAEQQTPVIGDQEEAEAPDQGTTEAPDTDNQADGQTEEGDLDQGDPYQLDTAIGARDLAARIADDPALEAALEANPELKNQLFANARRASRVDKYEEVFASPDEARVAAEQHGVFSNMRGLLADVNDLQTTGQFIDAMIEQSYLLNEDGTPQINPTTGKPRTDGSVGRLFKHAFELRALNWHKEFEQQNDEQGMAAIDYLMERLGASSKPSTSSEDESLPADVRARAAAVEQREKALAEQTKQQQETRETEFWDSVASLRKQKFDAELDKYFKNATGLVEANRPQITTEIKQELLRKVEENATFKTRYDRLKRQGLNETTKQSHVALAMEVMRDHLPKIVSKAFAKFGEAAISQQKQQDATQAARAAASRGDGKTALGGARPAAPMDSKTLYNSITEQLRKSLGRDPEPFEVLTGINQFRSSQPSALAR